MAKQQALQAAAKGNVVTFSLGTLNKKQTLFYDSKTFYTAYGGAKGGGKTHAVRVISVYAAMQYPGIKILIIRRKYPELQKNHIDPMKSLVPEYIAKYNGQVHTMYFENGSTIHFGHYNGKEAESEYQGQEYDWIFIDEATQFSEHEFDYIGGCVRGANNIPKRLCLTCNPGGVGHRWVKRLFIDRDFRTYTDDAERDELPNDYSFIFATVEDNEVMLEKDPMYIKRLSKMPENMRKAMRYGDWNVMSGNYFPEFREDTHTIEPFKIPESWMRYRVFDYGRDMMACYWIAVDTGGRCYVYREFKQGKDNQMEGLLISEAAKEVLNRTLPTEHISMTLAPPDMWKVSDDTGKTKAETFAINGLPLVKASNNRVQGWYQVREFFKEMPDGKPGMLFTKNCVGVIDDIQSIQMDEDNPDDCAKEPHDITHSCDAIRYFCISRTLPAEVVAQIAVQEEDDVEEYDDFMTGGEITASYLTYGGK